MTRSFVLSPAALALVASLAFAEPQLSVSYPQGVPRIAIAGDYPQTRYTVLRAPAAGAAFQPITEGGILCMGSCYALDPGAEPGASYLYRFDLILPDGSITSFGPYPVVISPTLAARVRARLWPNPGGGKTRIELFLGGTGDALLAEARIYDLQGRAVVTLHRGLLARGPTSIDWSGRGDDGRTLASGLYLLRFTSPLGSTVARVIRAR